MRINFPSNIHIAKQLASRPATKSFAAKMSSNMPPAAVSEEDRKVTESSGISATFESIGIKNTQINEKPGVSLDERRKVLVGSVLDLFDGNPTLKHFSLWAKDATFQDPITTAVGFDRYLPQWYGLPALFNPIAIKSHTVISSGNPIELELENSYTLKGLGLEQTMKSVVSITTGHDGKIVRVEDRWNNKIPQGALAEGLRKLNSATVPMIVKVPKTEEEDQQTKAAREKAQKTT